MRSYLIKRRPFLPSFLSIYTIFFSFFLLFFLGGNFICSVFAPFVPQLIFNRVEAPTIADAAGETADSRGGPGREQRQRRALHRQPLGNSGVAVTGEKAVPAPGAGAVAGGD